MPKNDFKPLNISIENFMGFKNKTEFELSRINLFVGANSTGKSTLKQLFKYFQKDIYHFDESLNNMHGKYNVFRDLQNRLSSNSTIRISISHLDLEWEEYGVYRIDRNSDIVGFLNEVVFRIGSGVICRYTPLNNYMPPGPFSEIEINIPKFLAIIHSKEYVKYNSNVINYKIKPISEEDLDKLRCIKNEIISLEVSVDLLTGRYMGHTIRLIDYMRKHGYEPISVHGQLWISLYFLQVFSRVADIKNGVHFIHSNRNIFQSKEEYELIPDSDFEVSNKFVSLKDYLSDKLGLETRLLSINDNAGKYYGSQLQVNHKGIWFYLEELSEGMRCFVNLVSNLGYVFKVQRDPFRNNGVIFIEEPEVMLHPDFQVDFVNYLIDIHESSKIVILETHSLHILRTVQLAVAEGRLAQDDVRIFDFSMDDNEGIQVSNLHINKTGLIEGEFKSGFVDLAREMDMKLWRIQHLHNNKN